MVSHLDSSTISFKLRERIKIYDDLCPSISVVHPHPECSELLDQSGSISDFRKFNCSFYGRSEVKKMVTVIALNFSSGASAGPLKRKFSFSAPCNCLSILCINSTFAELLLQNRCLIR